MLAVSPSSAKLWCFSSCLIGLPSAVFRTLPGSLLRLAGGTGGIRLDMIEMSRLMTMEVWKPGWRRAPHLLLLLLTFGMSLLALLTSRLGVLLGSS